MRVGVEVMSDVFISYSRRERVFADSLASELEKDGRTVWIDRARIELTSEWWEEIKRGIEASDNFILIMSPDSMASPVCHLEIEYARQLTKRIIPVYHIAHDYEGTKTHFGERLYKYDGDGFLLKLYGERNPMLLFEENWQIIPGINRIEAPVKIIERDKQDTPTKIDEADFQTFFPSLRKAIDTDIEHVHQHTYLFNRTRDWLRKGQKTSDLLNGVETLEAEKWLQNWETDKADREARQLPAKDPQPNDDIRAYIIASREAEEQRKRLLRNLRVGTLTFAVVGTIAAILAISSFISLQDTQARADIAATHAADAVTAVGDANSQLTAVPPTLTQVNQQVVTAQGQADFANTQVAVADAALTAVPPTLTQVNQQVITAQVQANLAATQAADAVTAVADASNQLTAVPPTLTYVAQLIEDGEQHIEALRLAAEAHTILNDAGNPETAALLSIYALRLAYTKQADASLTQALDRHYTVRRFLEHQGNILDVAVSSDGRTALSAGDDGGVYVWDLTTGEVSRTLEGHSDSVTSIAISSDNRAVVSGSADGTVRIWDLQSGTTTRILTGHTRNVQSVAMSHDDRYILSTSLDATLRIWDAATGENIHTFEEIFFVQDGAFSPTGNFYFSGGSNTPRMFDFETGDIVNNFIGVQHTIDSIAVSPNGELLAAGACSPNRGRDGECFEGVINVWRTDTAQHVALLYGHLDEVTSLAFYNNRYLISGSADTTIRLWDLETNTTVRILREHRHPVQSALVLPNNRYILSSACATMSSNGTCIQGEMRLWDIFAPSYRLYSTRPHEINSFAISPLDDHVAIGSCDSGELRMVCLAGSVRFWKPGNIEPSQTIFGFNGFVDQVVVSPDARYVFGQTSNEISVFDTRNQRHLHSFTGFLYTISTDYQKLASVTCEEYDSRRCTAWALILWEIDTGAEIMRIDTLVDRAHAIAWQPNTEIVLVGTSSGQILYINTLSGEIEGQIDGHDGAVLDFAISADGSHLASAGQDHLIQLWDMTTQQHIMSFAGHSGAVNTIAFSPDNQKIVSGSADTTVRLWDATAGVPIRTLQAHTGPITNVAFGADGQTIYSSSQDTTLRVWQTDIEAFISHACSILYRDDFSPEERAHYQIPDNLVGCPRWSGE